MPDEKKRELYAAYSEAGYKIKVYDYPMMQTAGKKRYLREFDIEEKMTPYLGKFVLIFAQYFAILEGRRSDYHAKYSPYF